MSEIVAESQAVANGESETKQNFWRTETNFMPSPRRHSNERSLLIDLESDSLSLKETRAIRVNIQHDVQQLKNRVRLLQEEEQRALRQIYETRTKTQKIRQIMAENEAKLHLTH